MENIERLLLEEPCVTKFVKEEWDLPQIDFSLWKEGFRSKAEKYYNKVVSYLDSSYVEDSFTDHNSRRDWRKEMYAKHDWFHDFYSKHPFRNNRINVVMESARMLRLDYIGENRDELMNLIEQITRTMIDGEYYTLMTIDQKQDYVSDLKEGLNDILEFLGNQSELILKKRIII